MSVGDKLMELIEAGIMVNAMKFPDGAYRVRLSILDFKTKQTIRGQAETTSLYQSLQEAGEDLNKKLS